MIWSCKKKEHTAPIRRCEIINLPEYRRGREKPKKSWNELIRNDLNYLGLIEHMAQDRSLCVGHSRWTHRGKYVQTCHSPWSMVIWEN